MANITLDGVNDVFTPGGNIFWSDNGTLGGFIDLGAGAHGISLTGNWFGQWIGFDGGTMTVSDSGGANLTYLNLGGSTNIDLDASRVENINIYGNGTHDIALGSEYMRTLSIGGQSATVEVNDGGLGKLDVFSGASAEVTVNGYLERLLTSELGDMLMVQAGGNVESATLNEGDNTVTLDNGFIGLLDTGDGADSVTIGGTEAGVYFWMDRGGANDLTITDNARLKYWDFREGSIDVTMSGNARMEQGEADNIDLDATLTENARIEYHKQFGGSLTANVSDSARIDQLIFGEGDSDITVTGNGRVNNMRLEEGTHTVSTGERFFKSAEFWNADFDITVGTGGAGKIDAGSETARSQTITTNGYVDSIQIYDDQDVNLTMNAGGGWVRLDDIKDELFINNDFVRTIETRGGRDDIVIDNGGGVGLFATGDDGDRLKITDGSVDVFDAGGGNDRLNSRNNGELGTILMGNGSDRAQIRAGFTELLSLGGGTDRAWVRHEAEVGLLRSNSGESIIQVRDTARVEAMQIYNGPLNLRIFDTTMVGSLDTNNSDTRIRLFDDARINSMKLDQGTQDIVTNNGHVESLAMWDSSSTLEIGMGGASQIHLAAQNAQIHDLNFVGYVGQLQVLDNQTTTLTWDAEGGRSFRTAEGDDVVVGGEGFVEVLSTRDGNDAVTVSGGLEVLRTGNGEDTVITGDGFIGMINTGDDNDNVLIGTGFVGLTRLGNGDDRLTVDPAYNDFGLTIWAGSGNDEVTATSGDDVIYGGTGLDTIAGGQGNDSISGGDDADTFVFDANTDDGTVRIMDFEQGIDIIDLNNFVGGFGALTIQDEGNDIEVDFGTGEILLHDLIGTTLTAADFDLT